MSERLTQSIQRFKNLISQSTDSEDVKTRKLIFIVSCYISSLGAFLLGVIYLNVSQINTGGVLSSYAVLTIGNLIFFYVSKRFNAFSYIQLMLMLVYPFMLYLSLNNPDYLSSILIWSLIAPIVALVLHGYKKAFIWFFDYFLLMIALVIIDNRMSPEFDTSFIILQANILTISTFFYLLFQYFVRRTEIATETLDTRHKILVEDQERSQQLLNNLLPEPIAERLKQTQGMIADSYDDISVLFADIVGFTRLSTQVSPKELVDLLNVLFSGFDMIAEKRGLEKIKTMGDAYMVASGLPIPMKNHAEAAAEMALEMQDEVARFSSMIGENISVRIGINSGPVVAGVIGIKKSIYDLWGDTVNVASRMESTGIPGKIQVTENTYSQLKQKFHFINRGEIPVKGKGFMNVYILEGRKEEAVLNSPILQTAQL
jgi:adenylate cyclase